MATYHAVGEPVNDSERLVLESLRDGLPADWYVLGNFEIDDGRRSFESDAVVIAPGGWAYVVEVKHLDVVEGNDATWMVRNLGGANLLAFDSPYGITRHKARKLAGMIKRKAPASVPFVEPLIVIVTNDRPKLTGGVASVTCTHLEVVQRVQVRPTGKSQEIPEFDASVVFEALTRDAKPLGPTNQLAGYVLDDLMAIGPSWMTWLAHGAMSPEHPLRLKHYEIDPLLPPDRKRIAVERALRDSRTLYELQGDEGVATLVAMPQEIEGGIIVATRWPDGQSLASHIERGLDCDRATRIFHRLVDIISDLHGKGVIHRNLSPVSVYLGTADRVTLTDFDFSRVEGQPGVTSFIAEDDLDREFVAPEVLVDPTTTTKASDVWSLARIGVVLLESCSQSESVLATLHSALDLDPANRPDDARMLAESLIRQEASPTVFDLEPGDVIDERYVVEGALVEGGHSIVYRATDTRTSQDLALKFAKPGSGLDLAAEISATEDLRTAPGLSIPMSLLEARSVRRKGIHAFQHEFLTLRWIDGRPLNDYLEQGFSLGECFRIGSSLARACGVLHENGVVHRDIKPENVILDANSMPWLIDFNVSVSASSVDYSIAGTPWYQPADVALGAAEPDVDVYAITGTVVELISRSRLEGRFLESLDRIGNELPEKVTKLLRLGLAPRPHRPANGVALASVLDEAAALLVARDSVPRVVPVTTPPNTNPVVVDLVQRFSQSSLSNAGTRGLGSFDSDTYVETLLDGDLAVAITASGPRLVVVTGNAGDGKTAFLQRVEEHLRGLEGITDEVLPNGVRISTSQIDFESNWDGSQDETHRTNDEVITEFLSPFQGESPEPSPRIVRLIAINEGRLLDFVGKHYDRFPRLASLVESVMHGEPIDVDWLEIVNLNMRTLTAASGPGGSVVERTLRNFSDPMLWVACEGCDYRNRCPIRWNAEVLNEGDSSSQVASRIQQTVDIVRLRQQLHVTMRDLRSALAFIITGNSTCQDVASHIQNGRERSLLNLAFFNNLFAASQLDLNHPRLESARADRLLSAIGDLDVARFSSPVEDVALWLEQPLDGGDPTDPNSEVLRELSARVRFADDPAGELDDVRLLHASLRRRALMTSRDPEWDSMLPFKHLRTMRSLLVSGERIDPSGVLEAISLSDGFPTSRFPRMVGVQTGSGTVGRANTFITHPYEDFDLQIDDRRDLATRVEYVPSTLRLSHQRESDTWLTIDLETYEMLEQVAAGNLPSLEQRQGHWIELNVFKEKLRRLPSQETILIDDAGRIFEITARDDMVGVQVEKIS